MKEKIIGKLIEDNIEYYLVKSDQFLLPRRYSKDELMKRNKKLIDEYENKNKEKNFLIKRKRKKSNSDDDDNAKDLSSEETQRIHRNKKFKKEKEIENKSKNNRENIKRKDNVLIKKNNENNNNKNEKMKGKNNNLNNLEIKKEFKEDNKQFREGVLINDNPKKIVNVGVKNRNEKTLYCLVEWEQNPEIEILDSIVKYDKVKEKYPKLLLDFFESKLVFLYDE